MNLNVNVFKKDEGSYLVVIDGRLDSVTYTLCEEQLMPILNSRTRVLTFDMSNLSFISSMGIRVIIKARKAIETAGGKVLMAHLQPQIAKIFEIAAALPKYQIFQSIKEADDYFAAIQRREIEKQQGNDY